jgi:hypothetical protein
VDNVATAPPAPKRKPRPSDEITVVSHNVPDTATATEMIRAALPLLVSLLREHYEEEAQRELR